MTPTSQARRLNRPRWVSTGLMMLVSVMILSRLTWMQIRTYEYDSLESTLWANEHGRVRSLEVAPGTGEASRIALPSLVRLVQGVAAPRGITLQILDLIHLQFVLVIFVVILSSFTIRLISGSWFWSLVSASVVLSRGHLFDLIGDLSVHLLMLVIVSALTLLQALFGRFPASLWIMLHTGLCGWGAYVLDPLIWSFSFGFLGYEGIRALVRLAGHSLEPAPYLSRSLRRYRQQRVAAGIAAVGLGWAGERLLILSPGALPVPLYVHALAAADFHLGASALVVLAMASGKIFRLGHVALRLCRQLALALVLGSGLAVRGHGDQLARVGVGYSIWCGQVIFLTLGCMGAGITMENGMGWSQRLRRLRRPSRYGRARVSERRVHQRL